MNSPQVGEFSIPAFIIKLYDILEEHNQENFGQIIRWSDDGEYFIVLQHKMMENKVLLLYFKHNHFTSFLRQLNMYEFVKTRNSDNHQIFSHPHFKRGQKQLLPLIKRNPIKCLNDGASKKKPLTKTVQKEKVKEQDYYKQLEYELNLLKAQQSQFEFQFSHIISQNENIVQQHKNIYSELNQSKKVLDVKIDRVSYLLSYIIQQNNLPKQYEFDNNQSYEQLIQSNNYFGNINNSSNNNSSSNNNNNNVNNPINNNTSNSSNNSSNSEQQKQNIIQSLASNKFLKLNPKNCKEPQRAIAQLPKQDFQFEDRNNLNLLSPLMKNIQNLNKNGNYNPFSFISLSPQHFLQEDQIRQTLCSPQYLYQLRNSEMNSNQSPNMSRMMSPGPVNNNL